MFLGNVFQDISRVSSLFIRLISSKEQFQTTSLEYEVRCVKITDQSEAWRSLALSL